MAIAALELLLLVVLGWRMVWVISGPLLYLFFLVPFGAFVTPVLQRFTADFTVVGLNLLAIPNYADNFVIETPAGTFFVAEACAGLRFLIAAVAFGTFYALLNFVSWRRRAVFIAASIAVPIVANGFRALGIVVLGQILGSAEAAAADHIVYGWLFFSIVMLLLVAAGHPFREYATVPNLPAPVAARPWPRLAPISGVLLTLVLVGAGPAIAAAIDARAVSPNLASLPTWRAAPGCDAPTQATTAGSSAWIAVRCGDLLFDVAIVAFPARSTSGPLLVERRRVTQELGAEDASVSRLNDLGADRGVWTVVQTTEPDRVTAYASWVDGAPVTSGLAARLAQAKDSILGADQVPVLVTVSAAEPPRASAQERRHALDQLQSLVAAQTDFSAEIARASRVP